MLDITLDHETMRRLGSGLGCGAISILTDDCPVAVAASVLAYFDRENAGQCGSCFNGTAAMAAVTEALRDGVADHRRPGPAASDGRWCFAGAAPARRWTPRRTSPPACCGQFPQVVARHLDNDCDACRAARSRADRPYEMEAAVSGMKIRLDRTMCDGFGMCAKHAPEYFSLDDWGYASLEGNGTIPEQDRAAVMRALLDCPVHAIIEMGEHRPSA